MVRKVTILAAIGILAAAAACSSTSGTGTGGSSSSTGSTSSSTGSTSSSTTSSSTSSGTTGTGGAGGGVSGEKLPIGSPCAKDADCGGADFMCMTDHPGGYCVKMCDIKNTDADCPSESICQYDGTAGECHLKCAAPSDCRAGYVCAPASTDPSNTASHAFCDVADTPDAGMD